MIPDPKKGDFVKVTVSRGHGDDYKAYPPAPARVVYVSYAGVATRKAGGKGSPLVTVALLADAAPGWYRGDTYRTTLDHLWAFN